MEVENCRVAKLKDKIIELELKVLSCEDSIDRDFAGVYVCDLLSWVMSHANEGDIWITVLTNVNVPAVALLTEVSCVIIPEDIKVEENTIKKANENGILILSSSLTGAQLCNRLMLLSSKSLQ
jgi:hypothetical protein